MPDYSAGTASIRIRPNADQFLRDLEAKLRAMRDPGFNVHLELDKAAADREAAAWRAEQESHNVDQKVDPDTKGASAEMAVWRQREESKQVNVTVVVDHQGANRQISRIEERLNRLGRSDLVRLNIGALGLAGIAPAAAGLAELAGALQQVAQAGLAVPGGVAAAAASIGTLALGINGVKDAYDAVVKASMQSGRNQEDTARQAAAAQNTLRNAVVDEVSAQKDVANARRDALQQLQDLNVEMRGGMISESRAILEATKAREDLAKGNFSDIRDAALRVTEADQRLLETRTRNVELQNKVNDANTKGVANSDQVVGANERLTRSHQQVAEAQANASKATSEGSVLERKAAQALELLSPNARKFVEALVELRPAWQDFQATASEPLFAGKAEEITGFFNDMLPTLKTGVGGIAQAWNQNISALLNSLGSPEGKGIIDRILGNTGDAQSRLSNAIDPMVKGLGTLAAAGTDVLPRLADGFTGVMERFRNFIVEADKDGRLDKWINDGIDGLANLGNAALNIGKAFTGITQAAGGGKSFLQWLEDATGRLQTFLNSTEGQNTLREYFAQGRDILVKVKDVLVELPGMLKSLADAATHYVGGLLPILREVAGFLGDHPGLVKAVVTAYITWNTIKPIVTGLTGVLDLFNKAVIGVGTGFYQTRDNAKKAMKDVDDVFTKSGHKGSPIGKFSGAVAGLSAVGGPLALLATAAAITVPIALDKLGEAHRKQAEKVDFLNQRELALETTLDRVTGKITGQTREAQIAAARNFDPGGPGGGVPGISKGNAVDAATSLGIPPDLYADALTNNPQAMQQVRDVLINNNLLPELSANANIGNTLGILGKQTGGKINQDLLVRALLGDPEAVKQYTDLTGGATGQLLEREVSAGRLKGGYDLTAIARQLSPTGQASVFAGGALNTLTAGLPAAQTGVNQTNQALVGGFRLNDAGRQTLGGDFPVNASGTDPNHITDYKVSAANLGPMQLEALNRAGLTPKQNLDGTWEITLPAGSPLVEKKYAKGSRGVTPGPRGKGFLAELHGQEWVHDAGTVDRYGPDVMDAMWRGQIDPKALRGLVPGFWWGGPTDPNDPNNPNNATHFGTHAPPGPSTASVAPNPYDGGGIPGVVGSATTGLQGPLNNLTGLIPGFPPGLQPQTGMGAGMPTQMPVDPAHQWFPWLSAFEQTGNPFAGAPDKIQPQNIAQQFGSALLQGVLGFFGLENSILSPNNPYNQAAQQTIGFYGNKFSGQQQGVTSLPFSNGATVAINPQDAAALNAMYGSASVTSDGTLAPDPNNKDIIGSMSAIASKFGLPLTSGHRDEPGSLHSIDQAGDFSNGTRTDQELALANYIADNYAGNTKELIFDDPRFTRTIKDGKIVGPFGAFYTMGQAGDHTDHVHWAIGEAVMQQAAAPGQSGLPASFLQQLYGGASAPPVGVGRGSQPLAGLKGQAYQMYMQSGLPPAEWDAFDQLIQHESGWDPTAQNPKSTAYGLGQFLDTTWGSYGGTKTDDPLQQLGLVFKYIKERPDYKGSPAAAWRLWQERGAAGNAWYDTGGWLPPGLTMAVNKTRKPEAVLTHDQGQAIQMIAKRAANPTPPRPQVPDAQQMIPPAATMQPPPVAITPPPPPVPQPLPTPAGPPAQFPGPAGGVAPAVQSVAPPPSTDHTMPWVKQGIESGFAAAGNAAAAAATMGMGMGGGGGMGGMIQGAFGQLGKIASGVANVVSSSLVGSVPGSFTTTESAYGQTLRPDQRQLATATPRGATTSYGPFFGHDTRSVMQEINLHESLNQQTAYANRGVR